ncbi:MAG TPA: HEAT repeat domain-containing protein [Saprospiraceae bacterium]|nr:HEAT repeat domain-containing protein [Saprospiraceae bacterium]
MSEITAQQLIEKYNRGLLEKNEERLLEQYIEQGLIQIEDLKDLHHIDQNLDLIFDQQVEGRMRESFFDFLNKEKTNHQHSNNITNGFWNKLFANSIGMRLAYSLILVILGFGVGTMLNPVDKHIDQMATLSGELSQMREMMMLTMLEKESTSDRLKAVSLTNDMSNVSERVATALLHTLNNDENVNVRLATLESLYSYADNPKIRKGLIESIKLQKSPLVQIALAEIMVALQEKRSVNELRKLLHKKETPEEVKEEVKNSLEVLM